MGRHVSDDSLLRTAKARMGLALGGGVDGIDPRLGDLTLRPHQVDAAARLLEIIGRFRGALLADAVGLGKTYVALAVARAHRAPLVICPAVLRPMWERARVAAGVSLPIMSTESLSRGATATVQPDLLIVDEAHHLRTPGTRRYEAAARIARRARVLLLSATPLHNSRHDLGSLLALFAGSSVHGWSDPELARLIVRRDERGASQPLPVLDGPHPLAPARDENCLDAILGLPPAVPAADEGTAHALATISLIHLWTSSRAALVASARKRQARALALREAIAAGRVPTSAELAAWRYADNALQLAFPLFETAHAGCDDVSRLESRLDAFIAAAGALIDACRMPPNPDDARVQLLRSLRAAHPGARCVAFSQYAHTVTALGRLMREDNGIAVITADGGQIASGAVGRDEVLAQFAGEAGPARPAERVDLLLTTDLLSEGIDLRGASVIVHLDLPWNPARLEQREGRARRLGSRFEAIHVYSFVPPAAAERMLELERRLTGKLRTASAIVGGRFHPFSAAAADRSSSASGAAELLHSRICSWAVAIGPCDDANPAVAAAQGSSDGWIALVILDGLPRLIGSVDGGVTDDPKSLLRLVGCLGAAISVDRTRTADARRDIDDWLASRRASAGAGDQSAAKRAVLDRLAQTVARAPRHRWASVVASAQRARARLSTISGIGAERVLATLARSSADDAAWLLSLEAFGDAHANENGEPRSAAVISLILLEKVSPAGDATPG